MDANDALAVLNKLVSRKIGEATFGLLMCQLGMIRALEGAKGLTAADARKGLEHQLRLLGEDASTATARGVVTGMINLLDRVGTQSTTSLATPEEIRETFRLILGGLAGDESE